MEKTYIRLVGLPFLGLFASFLYAADVPGTLDTSFNLTGTATVAVGNDSVAYDIAIQQNGHIVLVGSSGLGGGDSYIALAQFAADGSLIRTTTASFIPGGDPRSQAVGVAVQQDGKIVVAGVEETGAYAFGVARFNQDLSLDDDFNTIGTATTFIGSEVNSSSGSSVAIQADGKIVVAGRVNSEGGSFFGVARFNDDGSLDLHFGEGSGTEIPGTVVVAGAYTINSDEGATVALQQDGKIVLLGAGSEDDSGSMIVVRLEENGSLDATFGSGGVVKLTNIVSGGLPANGLALQHDGKIIVAGGRNADSQALLVVARLKQDGSVDTTFNGGEVSTTIDNQQISVGTSVALQNDGKIVATGVGANMESGVMAFGVARFNPNGTLDTTFNPAGAQPGTALVAIGAYAQATGVALQTDGKIVLGGRSSLEKDSDVKMAVARLFGDEGDVPPSGNSLFIQRLIEKYHSRV